MHDSHGMHVMVAYIIIHAWWATTLSMGELPV